MDETHRAWWNAMVPRVHRTLLRVAQRIGFALHDAENAVQTALCRAWGSFRPDTRAADERPLVAYLKKTISRLWIDFQRRKRPGPIPPADRVAPDLDPLELASRSEANDRARAALAELPPEDQHLILAAAIDGRSCRDFADDFGLHASTISRRCGSVHNRLRSRLAA